MHPKTIKIGDCDFAVDSGTIVNEGRSIRLDPKSIDVLTCLLQANGQVVSHDQFMESVWNGKYVTNSQIAKHIAELRRAFGDSQKPRRYIETLSKRGYRLICEANFVANSHVASGTPIIPATEIARNNSFWKSVIAVSVLILLVGSIWFLDRIPDSDQDSVAEQPVVTPSTSLIPLPSIVVLPFLDLSPEQNQEYLSDGMTEELLNFLAQIPELRVVSRTSSFYFKENAMDVPAIAARLDVDHVLEGSISRYEDRVRVTAQLIDANLDSHIWSQSYDREFGDLFAIQTEIAEAVTERFRITLLNEPNELVHRESEIHALYMQARYYHRQLTSEGRNSAIELFLNILELDPNHVGALASLGLAYIDQVAVGELSLEEGQVLSMEMINRALAIDPNHAPIHLGLAYQAMFTNDMESGAVHFARAIELAPNNVEILFELAVSRFIRYDYEEALRIADYLEARDPLNPIVFALKARILALNSQWEEAADNSQTALRLSPGHNDAGFILGVALIHMGKAEAALSAFQQDQRIERITGLTLAYHALGDEDRFQSSLSELEAGWGQSSPSAMAEVYAYLNDKDTAFYWLEKSLDSDLKRLFIHTSPLLLNLHTDPRWATILKNIGTSREQLESVTSEQAYIQ